MTAEASDRTRQTHFPLFDSMRAIAALTVFLIHCVYQIAVNRPEDHAWYRFGVHLDVAVPIFFGVSGFLLYRPFLAATLAGRAPSLKAYAWRRVLRIVPAYWVALAVITIWFDLREVKSLEGVLRFGLFLQIYDGDTALKGLGQAWTLGVEVTYYAFLPLFAIGIARARSIRTASLGVGALIVSSVLWKAFALTQTDAAVEASGPWLYPLPSQLDHLGMGMLLAVLSVAVAQRGGTAPGLWGRLVKLVERRPAVPWLAAFAVWVLCSLVTESGSRYGPPITDPQYLVKHELYALFVFLLLLPAVFGDHERRTLVRRVLAWRPLVYVGTISYSFYLFHYAVIAQQARWWDRFPTNPLEWTLWTALALAGSVALGSLGYFLVEKPFMSLKRLVPAGPRAAQVEAAQARAAP
ncbi:MAG TPA: acyltransferase [Solirubrobacteraceae bacterium]|nr:acyltransferase [Solirubrobacteraceae bacterium]